MDARFYCESCGREVPARANRCPYCGKVFSAVRCPSCGFEGRHGEFLHGCPVCGYLAGSGESPDRAGGPREGRAGGSRGAPRAAGHSSGGPPAHSLSRGFYRVAIVVLAAAIVALVLVLILRP